MQTHSFAVWNDFRNFAQYSRPEKDNIRHDKRLIIIMEYIVSARKYRPLSFDSVVGQTALTTTLKNAVKSGKLATLIFSANREVLVRPLAHVSLRKPSTARTPPGMARRVESARAARHLPNSGRTISLNLMRHRTTLWRTSSR